MVGLGAGLGRGWGSAGHSCFPPRRHRVSAHRDKGAEAAHRTLGHCLACSAHRAVASWARLPPQGPCACCALCPEPSRWAPASLCRPVLTRRPLLRVCWGARPLPALHPAPAPPVCRPGGAPGAGVFVSPWDPERRFLGLVLGCDPVPGADLARGGTVPAPRKSLALALGAGGAQILLVGDPCVSPHPARSWALSLPAWVGGEAEPALRRGRAEGEEGRKGRAARGRKGRGHRRCCRGPQPLGAVEAGLRAPRALRTATWTRPALFPFCTHVQEMNVFLLLSWTASREAGPVGGEAAWGPGVALELPSLPRAVPSPRQAPSHTPTPPAARGPEAQRVGVWVCWDAARGSCAPSPEAAQSGCFQGPGGSQHKSVSALGTCVHSAVHGRGLLPGGPGFAPVCWPQGGEVCLPDGQVRDAQARPGRLSSAAWREERPLPGP